MMGSKDIDHARIGEAIFGGGGVETDLPRDPFAPSIDAVADLSRRVADVFRGGWLAHIHRTIAIAARIRAEHPRASWPEPPSQSTHAELVAELRRLRPGLMESRTYAHVAGADPRRLAALVDAIRVIEAYRLTA